MPTHIVASMRRRVLLLGLNLSLGLSLAEAQPRIEPGRQPRWPDRTFDAVRVWIQPTSSLANWRPTNVDAARDAFSAWSVVEIGVPFIFVPDSTRAEVRVRWVDRFDRPISGHTVADHDGSLFITSATLDLAVHHHSGAVLEVAEMRALALHEVGHVLGIEHLADSTAVMAPAVRVRSLTAADRAAARRLYGFRYEPRPESRNF
jgi:predicted Zn-dependent protease